MNDDIKKRLRAQFDDLLENVDTAAIILIGFDKGHDMTTALVGTNRIHTALAGAALLNHTGGLE